MVKSMETLNVQPESDSGSVGATGVTDNESAQRDGHGRFVRGHKRVHPGGRERRRFSTWNTRHILEEYGVHPIALMVEAVLTGFLPPRIGEDPKKREPISNEERMRTLRDLASYAVPKLVATQITGKDEGPVQVATLDIAALMSDPKQAEAAQLIALALAQETRKIAARDQDYDSPGNGVRH
jgi:hypothetical protein